MLDFVSTIKSQIYKILLEQLGKGITEQKLPVIPIENFNVEYIPHKIFGDFTTNITMICAKHFKMSPNEIAKILTENIYLDKTYFKNVQISGGFINFNLADEFFVNVIKNINELENDYGAINYGENKKILVEYVSANPTGPMHIGNARGGATGDCLSNVLKKAGFDVTREFYINDAGNQIENFKKSLNVRYIQALKGENYIEFPEDGYHGDDVKNLVQEFINNSSEELLDKTEEERKQILLDFALPKNISIIKETLNKYRVSYDVWFNESDLHANGDIEFIINQLKEKGLTYEKGGALWYKSGKIDEEAKDEVLIKADGNYTYFVVDVAYHYNKFVKREFAQCINIQGADHHGHATRLKNAMNDLGIDSNNLIILLMQVVRLVKDGEVVKMSKRTGKSITLANLLEEVSVDVARFFFNMREINLHLDFDMNLAVKQSLQNPVYYVQYAHARICSIMKNVQNKQVGIYDKCLELMTTESEKSLVKYLMLYSNDIRESARTLDPSHITKYLIELATKFHKFYSECRVIDEFGHVSDVRLLLCKATKIVLKNGLALLKVSAPEAM